MSEKIDEKSIPAKIKAGEYQALEPYRESSSDAAITERIQQLDAMLERGTAAKEVVETDAGGRPVKYVIRSLLDGSILGYEDEQGINAYAAREKRVGEQTQTYYNAKMKKDVIQQEFGKDDPKATSH